MWAEVVKIEVTPDVDIEDEVMPDVNTEDDVMPDVKTENEVMPHVKIEDEVMPDETRVACNISGNKHKRKSVNSSYETEMPCQQSTKQFRLQVEDSACDTLEKWNLEFLLDRCQNRDKLLEFLRSCGLLSKQFLCGACGLPMKCLTAKQCKDAVMWRCSRDKRWRSIRKGSWFERSKLSLKDITLATYCWCCEYHVDQAAHECNLSDKIIIDWFSLCREMTSQFIIRRSKIGGKGKVIEIGVYSLGKNKRDVDNDENGKYVFCGVVRASKPRHLFLVLLEKRSVDVLLDVIQENVLSGSVIYSDLWKDYGGLSDQRFKDFSVNHSIELRENSNSSGKARVDIIWGLVLRYLGRGKRQKDKIQSYLDEFVWRRSILSGQCKFRDFVTNLALIYPPMERDM